MRIITIADMHGSWGYQVPPHDILCICGDMLGNPEVQAYCDSLIRISEENHSYIFYVPGNHDGPLYNWFPDHPRVFNLIQSGPQTVENQVFAGFNWSFWDGFPGIDDIILNGTGDLLTIKSKVKEIPYCNFLISHSPPLGILDSNGNRNCGVLYLFDHLRDIGCTNLYCGHIHTSGGCIQVVNGITVINTAEHLTPILYQDYTRSSK